MSIFLGIIIGLISLTFLVTIHELGHFIAARRNGVKVNEFGIGFPPRAIAWVKGKDKKWHKLPKSEWKKEQKTLILSLNWLPIGGFCAMDGESDADTKPHTFGAASFWQKTKILFAGVAMNWLAAIIIFTILAWVGMPQFLEGQFAIANDVTYTKTSGVHVTKIIENSPAEAAGIQENDYIISVGGQEVDSVSELKKAIDDNAGQMVEYGIERGRSTETTDDDETLYITVVENDKETEPILGVYMSKDETFSYSTWSAPLVGIGTTFQLTGATFQGLGETIGNLFSGVGRLFSPDEATRNAGSSALESVSESVSGPVGILGSLFPAFADSGIQNLLFLVALISISLACMNVLPIPALDGGRWFLILIFKLAKKPLTKEKEEKIVSRAMYILLIIAAIVTLLDVVNLWKNYHP